MNKQVKAVLIALGVLLVFFVSYSAMVNKNNPSSGGEVACTMEAKLCPDGSYVGRSGPRCEFAPCPGENAGSSDSKIYTDGSTGISYSYPATLGTQYISTTDWPPRVQFIEEAFTCNPAGAATARAGITEKISISGREYCRTTVVEGAAGSTYTMYAYAFPDNDSTIILTFSLRSVQCGNYDEPQRSACENERTNFSADKIVDRIRQSIKFQ